MIPILYDSNETVFNSNGLGRLRDIISCQVLEERNSVYECDFEYPVNGAHFNEIVCGRIIAAEHDSSNDVQPFDIVSSSKPINGIVKFHAVHISYRQSKIVTYATNVNSLLAAFTLFQTFGEPTNPFTYGSDMATVSETRYIAAFNGEPRSIRALLGGVEGSILDTYGGEFEWDRFKVYLHSERGQIRDYTIRYGVNLRDYNEDADYSETYSSIIPYWKGTDSHQQPIFVIGSRQSYSQPTITNRRETIPVDLTDKFESQPTQAQVEAMGQTYLDEQQPILPKRNIKVDFIRLQDTDEYAHFTGLFDYKLCDSIRVIFPTYKMDGYFKIVKVVWDVLAEKYESMELGALPVTLSQALGLNK